MPRDANRQPNGSMRTFRRTYGISVPPHYQSHHLIPVGVFSRFGFAQQFRILRHDGFDVCNFRQNGLFLPSTEIAAIRSGLPLHRGPHRHYNDLVAYRVAVILRDMTNRQCQFAARRDAVQRLAILTAALRNILHQRHPLIALNQRDPFGTRADFTELDGACDRNWQVTK